MHVDLRCHRASTTGALRSVLAMTLLLALVVGGCRELPHHPGRKVQVLEQGALTDLNPAEIIVAPIEYAHEGIRAPERMLREEMQRALIKRRYSPLALDYIDGRVHDASFGGLGADAVCRILIHAWDESDWQTGRLIRFDIEVRMVDAMDPETTLWAARYPGRVDVTKEESHKPEAALFRHAVGLVPLEIVGAMPPRDTSPGRQ